MKDPWIRVHANLANRPVVSRMAESLRIDPFRAIGHLVTFWGSVSAHAANGAIAGVPDALLERWAGWTGRRGAFARWVRTSHMDPDGRVNEWDAYQGKLEIKRERERQRVREFRQKLRDGTPSVTRTEDVQNARSNASVATHARERDGTERGSTSPPRADGFHADPRWVAFAEALPARNVTAWRAIVGQWLDGERWGKGTPAPTRDEVLDGLVAAVTAKDSGPMGEAFVRGCIERARTPRGPAARVADPQAQYDTLLAGVDMVRAAMEQTAT